MAVQACPADLSDHRPISIACVIDVESTTREAPGLIHFDSGRLLRLKVPEGDADWDTLQSELIAAPGWQEMLKKL
eukprot:8637710-Karenia_brevis.AAC.1